MTIKGSLFLYWRTIQQGNSIEPPCFPALYVLNYTQKNQEKQEKGKDELKGKLLPQ